MFVEVEFVDVDVASFEAQRALRSYFEELDRRFNGGFDTDAGMAGTAQAFQAATATFVVARAKGGLVGCGAVLYLDDDVAEIKRMWVSPDVRGLGIGKRLLRRLEDVARFAGRRTVLLHTNASLIEAIAMYEAAGYRRVDRYHDNSYAQLWFSRSLDER